MWGRSAFAASAAFFISSFLIFHCQAAQPTGATYPRISTLATGDVVQVYQKSGSGFVTKTMEKLDLARAIDTTFEANSVKWARAVAVTNAWSYYVGQNENNWLNSWANYGLGEVPFAFRFESPGRIGVQGSIVRSGQPAAYEPIFRAPDLFLSDYNRILPASAAVSGALQPSLLYVPKTSSSGRFLYNGSTNGLEFFQAEGSYSVPAFGWTVTNLLSSDPTIVTVPVNAPASGGTVVVYLHSAEANPLSHHNPWVLARWTNTVRALATNGWIVGAPQYRGDAWGNVTNFQSASNFIVWATNQFAPSNVVVVSESMGGVAGFQLLTQFPIIKKVYAVSPVCSLSNMWWSSMYSNAISGSYGITGAVNFAAQTAGYDPVLIATNLWTGKKVRVTVTDTDTIVPVGSNINVLSNRVSTFASYFAVTNTPGLEHGAPALIMPADLIDFIRNK